MRLSVVLCVAALPFVASLVHAHADDPSTGTTSVRVAPASPGKPSADAPAGVSELSTGSTGQSLESVEPTPAEPTTPREPITITLAEGETKKVVEGRTSKRRTSDVLWSAPVGSMISIRLSSPANQARLVVYQPGDDRAVPGSEPEKGAIAWIGTQERPGSMRFVVRTDNPDEIPFRISVETTPTPTVND